LRIAHLSDLHLRHHLPGDPDIPERLGRRTVEMLRRAMAQIAAARPDLVVLSGDLLDYPLGELDDPETRRQGEADLRLIADLLPDTRCGAVVIAGNHDHEELVRRVFGHQPEERECAGYRVISFTDRQDADYVPHRRGRKWERFEAALADVASPPQVHIQHYLVWPRKDEGYPYTYARAEEMVEAIVGSGVVRLVLGGHYHEGIPLFRVGETYFATAPAFCEAPHPYWIYDLEEGGAKDEMVICRTYTTE
jgi:3',5'-cyclic AMP phosphodiesterase CpdA